MYYGHHEVHGYDRLLLSTHADVAWSCATATVRQRTSIICPSFCKTPAVSTLAGAAPPTMVGKAAAQQHARHTRTNDILMQAEFGMSWCAGFSASFWSAYHDLIPRAKGEPF